MDGPSCLAKARILIVLKAEADSSSNPVCTVVSPAELPLITDKGRNSWRPLNGGTRVHVAPKYNTAVPKRRRYVYAKQYEPRYFDEKNACRKTQSDTRNI
jgi:hypothetical protein